MAEKKRNDSLAQTEECIEQQVCPRALRMGILTYQAISMDARGIPESKQGNSLWRNG